MTRHRLRFVLVMAAGIVPACGDESIGPEDEPPVFTSPVRSAVHNRTYRYAISVTDPEGLPVTVTPVALPAWITFDRDSLRLTGLAGWENLGTHRVVLSASDGSTTAEQRFDLTVSMGEIVCNQDFGDPASSDYVLPYPPGRSYTLIQGNCPANPNWGHHNGFAYDFDTAIGDTVVATRGGEVRFVREHFNDGNRVCGDENFVFIEHADGTVMHYMHLTRNGALVTVGDVVAQGQAIGLSGDTGCSSGPHVHVALFIDRTAFIRQRSLPINFANADGPMDSLRRPRQGAVFTANP